jgi:hypothetical protein
MRYFDWSSFLEMPSFKFNDNYNYCVSGHCPFKIPSYFYLKRFGDWTLVSVFRWNLSPEIGTNYVDFAQMNRFYL